VGLQQALRPGPAHIVWLQGDGFEIHWVFHSLTSSVSYFLDIGRKNLLKWGRYIQTRIDWFLFLMQGSYLTEAIRRTLHSRSHCAHYYYCSSTRDFLWTNPLKIKTFLFIWCIQHKVVTGPGGEPKVDFSSYDTVFSCPRGTQPGLYIDEDAFHKV